MKRRRRRIDSTTHARRRAAHGGIWCGGVTGGQWQQLRPEGDDAEGDGPSWAERSVGWTRPTGLEVKARPKRKLANESKITKKKIKAG
jgi:hypothetical protein